MEVLNQIIDFIVGLTASWGYTGIFLLMLLESSFFPFPSEVVIIPAGYLAFKGEMNFFLIIFVGVLGSIAGAWVNYIIAFKLGRKFLEKFICSEKLDKMDYFFKKHGAVSMFIGRLIPVFRQYISFPAGLTKMNGVVFTAYTAIGAGIWVTILNVLGYYIGDNEELIEKYLGNISVIIMIFVVTFIIGYYLFHKRKNKR